MLPEENLDLETFEEIMEDVRGMIPSFCPQWTDFNYHDPGITLLEMFAWLKEIQQFHLDQVGQEHRRKFAGLLGLKPAPYVPARILAKLKGQEPFTLKKGCKVYTNGMCFEVEESRWFPGGNLLKSSFLPAGGEPGASIEREQLELDGKFLFFPFGHEPGAGDIWELVLEKPVIPGSRWSLYVEIYDGYEVKRNPLTQPLPFPLAELEAWYETEDGWKPAAALEDNTWGLIQSGWIGITTDFPMGESHKIRFILKKADYDTAPVITAAGPQYIELVQKDTKAFSEMLLVEEADSRLGYVSSSHFLAQEPEAMAFCVKDGLFWPVPLKRTPEKEKAGETCFALTGHYKIGEEVLLVWFYKDQKAFCQLKEGTGFPGQRIETGFAGLMRERAGLLVEDVLNPGAYRQWTPVDSFDGSAPEDLHFQVEEETGSLLFGDGYHGMPPEGKILLIHVETTRGTAGNIKASRIEDCESLPQNSFFSAACHGFGGKDPESFHEIFLRAETLLKEDYRAISEDDFQQLIPKAPGLMIKACKVIENRREGQTIDIVVRPYSKDGVGRLSHTYRKNLLAYLEPRRLLGARIQIWSPEYIFLFVYAEVRIYHQYPGAGEMIEEVIRQFFKEQENEFGRPVVKGQLYGRIDSLEAVEEISMLTLEARGNQITRNAGGDLILPPYGVILLKQVECRITNR